MLLRSSEIKPLFIDLSPTQQCLKHSLPALFVPPSPSTHQPPNRQSRATRDGNFFHYPGYTIGAAAPCAAPLAQPRHLSPSLFSSLSPPSFRITEQHREFRQLALPFQPFASSLFLFFSLLFRIAWWLWPPSLQSPTINPPHSLPFRSLSTFFA